MGGEAEFKKKKKTGTNDALYSSAIHNSLQQKKKFNDKISGSS